MPVSSGPTSSSSGTQSRTHNNHSNSRFASHYVYDGTFPPEEFYTGKSGVDSLRDARFMDSITSFGSTNADSASTKSTVRMVNFREPIVSSVEDKTSTDMQQSFQVEEVITDDLLLRHPRTLFVLACVKAVIGVQLLLFGTIGVIYGASPYFTVLWVSVLMMVTSLVGVLFVQVRTKYALLIVYLVLCAVSTIASALLFALTSLWLTNEEQRDPLYTKHVTLLHDTRIAMYSLQMVLTPIYAICACVSGVVLCCAHRDVAQGRLSSAYFVSQTSGGHQNVLVPIDVRQVKKLPDDPNQAQMVTIGVQTLDRRV